MKILSGMRPTGKLHIGHYEGALRNWVKLSKKAECFFMVADYHAITTLDSLKTIKKDTIEMVADWLATGLDPKKCVIFQQSEVSEHTELAWILSAVTSYGDLTRMTQFKEFARERKGQVSAGLFAYPLLMAADILLYDTEVVPVGQDQKQHVEIARETAEKFNWIYGETFKLPAPMIL
ncbi:tryptophan--tRNA ligase, partial [Candidatus Azambacteria bacterium]|nr:tryptophan--tRNA ligase [Candidatus Azambacteria bacterium]